MSLLHHAPRLAAADAVRLARSRFGVDAAATPLPSERDQNFLLDSATGRFVLKISNATELRAVLEAQNAAMRHLASRVDVCPSVVPSSNGEEIVEAAGGFVRLVTWRPGVPLAAVRRQTRALLADLGRRLGQVDRALASFDHPALHRDLHWDLASACAVVRSHEAALTDPPLRRLVLQLVDRAEERLRPVIHELRRSTIHNDANDYNVLVGSDDDGDLYSRCQRVSGLVDFGDMVWSWTVADLAIAMAYIMLDKPEPLAAAGSLAAGYHEAHPLTAAELSIVFDLALLRLCASAAIAAEQQAQRPGDAYLGVSQAPIARTLPRLSAVAPRFAEAFLREACGLPPVPSADRVVRWLHERGASSAAPAVVRTTRPLVLDLSASSPLVSADPEAEAEPLLSERIAGAMRAAGADVAIGRYVEPRVFYTSPQFAAADPRGEPRTVHLGVDLFAPPGTPVHAPLPGIVYAFADNAAPFDYGPVIVLEHQTGDGDAFFTIYGHLSRESLAGLERGRRIDAGQPFAAIGSPAVNGGWTPHLHFQIATDLLGSGCDFPGVCAPGQQRTWQALSPDPNLILRLPGLEAATDDGDIALRLRARRSLVGANVRLAYREPLQIVRGWMQYVFDGSGRRYLDAYNNVPHVGHSHPSVVRVAADQMRVLNTNTRYLHDLLTGFAERLASTMPAPLGVCYFVNSGSEANELALRLARTHTGRRDVIVLEAAYHGNTSTLIDISPYKFDGPGGRGRQPWVHVVPLPDVYRGSIRGPDAAAGPKYADFVAQAIAEMRRGGSLPGAFIAETCPSVGGQIVFPPGYLRDVYAHIREAGGVCIADEVQTAYGRMGTSFYAFEDQQVVPDIVVLGKPIGNGYPLGAVVTTAEIAASFDNGMEYFSTFGGSTVSCAVGLAVLDVVLKERLQERADRVGGHLRRQLTDLAARHALIGDVRGSGLFFGVELVKNRDSLEPASEEASYIVNRLREERILIGTDGPFQNVLKVRPPMPFSEADADLLRDALEGVLRELA